MQQPFHGSPFEYAGKAAEQDYRFWLVVNPSKWLVPLFMMLTVMGIAIHYVTFEMIDGYKWTSSKAPAPAAVEAPAPAAQ